MLGPIREPAQDTMVELTCRTAGAVRHAPRLLRAWVTATELCVRDEAGMLLWLATDDEIAWVHDGQLSTAPKLNDSGADEIVMWEPATEVAALRTLRSAILWLGADPAPEPVAENARLFGRDVAWFDVPHAKVRNLRVAQDTETGVVMHISGTDPQHGNLLVEVTSIAVVPRDGIRFQARLQL